MLRWARKKAAEENTSVSKLVGAMLADQMRRSGDYWKAHEKWKTRPTFRIDVTVVNPLV